MSFDAGGLAQMTYQSHFNNNAIGVSGPGFASRGKGNHIKRLSVAPPSKISTIDETQQANICATPRTARGHLLAGLRTAPKSATVSNNVNSFGGLEQSKYAVSAHPDRAPQTSQAAFFPNNQQHNNHNHNGANNARQGYSSPDQVLAPPTLDFGMDSMNGMDQNTYDELVATNNYLAHQQRMLQQQLMSVQAAAHQLGGLSLNTQNMFGGNAYQSPMTPMSIYQQQLQQGLQPIVSPVVGNPGVYTVYNPMTGQSSYVMDNSAMQPQSTGSNTPLDRGASPVDFNQQQRRSPPSMMPPPSTRSVSPPKQSRSPPQEVEPLPPPSANAFRRGHRKNASSVNIKTTNEWTRTAPRPAGVPATPMTGTFGPGQARAGDHPVRQPRNPPHLAELQEKPTAKHEGSKNFSARQRRRAVHDLVKAGRDRLSERNSGSESGTPGSEAEFNFSVSSGDHDVIVRSANLSSKNSSGSLAAIGSERKEKSRERSSVDSTRSYGARSLSSDEGHAVGGNIVEVESNRRRTPLLVLSSAEKRKSLVL